MIKINFKQPKYIFPLVIFVPLCALIYFVMQTFGGSGTTEKDEEKLEHGYSEEELNSLDAAEAERIRQQQELEELERSLAESRRHINSQAYGNASGNTTEEFARDLEEIQRRSYERQKAIESGLGYGNTEAEEAAKRNVTVPIWSSSHPIRTQASSIRSRLRTMWWKPS